jgi:hypothetical protein
LEDYEGDDEETKLEGGELLLTLKDMETLFGKFGIKEKRQEKRRDQRRVDLNSVREFLKDMISLEEIDRFENQEEEEKEEETFETLKEEIPYMKQRQREEWDCESILSTYTCAENHPHIIKATKNNSATHSKYSSSPYKILPYSRHKGIVHS